MSNWQRKVTGTCEFRNSNSGPHAYLASMLPTKPSPQPHEIFWCFCLATWNKCKSSMDFDPLGICFSYLAAHLGGVLLKSGPASLLLLRRMEITDTCVSLLFRTWCITATINTNHILSTCLLMQSQGWSHRHLWAVSVNEKAINHFTGWLYWSLAMLTQAALQRRFSCWPRQSPSI